MAFPPRFLEELRARVSVVAVVGRRVRLVKRGREHTGLCPFHNEKSPSFTVSDDKGFFHCFGCGAHGDAIEFVRRTEGLGFAEAVERLAAEAGLEVPQMSPQAREEAARAATLLDVVEACAAWFEAQLWSQAGRKARDYLLGRGLTEATIRRFRLGYAPEGRGALKEAMLARKLPEPLLVESGMLIRPDGGGATYDRFRDRVMFPIGDRRGRLIAFGGRAFGDAQPKYLNSPDTPLFHKGRTLYHLSMAREASRQSSAVLVVEGYMDVIALAQAGIAHAVAPLGTALTEEQMQELWRLVPEPTVCLDGDAAGIRAAHRAAERALPLLKPGQSLRFALLPAGDDPDSLIKSQGRAAFDEAVRDTLPLAELLWRRETAGRPLDTPERRAALEQGLERLSRSVGDETVRGYYRQWFRDRVRQAFAPRSAARPAGAGQGGFGSRDRPQGGRGGFATALPMHQAAGLPPTSRNPYARRERLLLAMVLNHPALAEIQHEELAALDFRDPALDRLRAAILDAVARHPGLDSGSLARHLSGQGFAGEIARLVGPDGLPLPWNAKPDAAFADAQMAWLHVAARHRRLITLEAELRAAEAKLAEDTTMESWNRFRALQQAIDESGGDEAELENFGAASGRVSGL